MDFDGNMERKVKEWYAFINDVAGILCFTLAATALLSPIPESIASISFVYVTLWLIMKGRSYVPYLRREERIKGYFLSNFGTIVGTVVFIIGYGSLLFVAIGKLKLEHLQSLSFAGIFN